jgi:hypothetical protein
MSATDDPRRVKPSARTPPPGARRPNGGHVLAIIGIGATILTFDIAAARIHIPAVIVWMGGIVAVVMIAVPALAWLFPPQPAPRPRHEAAIRQTAQMCGRARRQLQRFLAQEGLPWSRDPTNAPLVRRRREQRANAILRRYRAQLYPWLLEVLDNAIALGGALPAARELLDARDVEQLLALPDLFREAEEELLNRGA